MPPPSLSRQPFINEPALGADESKKSPLRRFAPIASIEPEPEPDNAVSTVSEPATDTTAKEVVAESDSEPIPETGEAKLEPAPVTTKVVEPAHRDALDDDDLDVPAFIRRKVE